MHRTLLLASPSIATQEDIIKQLFTKHDRSSTDLQMLDRMNDGLVTLPADLYDLVIIIKDQHDPLRLLTRHVFATLVPAMKVACKLQTHDGMPLSEAETREAVLSGLVEAQEGRFEKAATADVVPLKLGLKVASNKVVIVDEVNWDSYVEDDDLIDEDEFITEEDFLRPNQNGKSEINIALDCDSRIANESSVDLQIPKDCKKRRRACKDCTCGLAERLETEDQAKQTKAEESLNILRLDMNDLNELDLTIAGRTGSCGNCALGDAFRCAGCPYIGFPAFKPGEEVKLLNEEVQQL